MLNIKYIFNLKEIQDKISGEERREEETLQVKKNHKLN